ncbi:MAG TPA: PDZ domain-containing protein [Chthoniobacterales bacterium]|nr:PDZ domain-containing protein [Chthoniobacterales bacterium]
MKKQLALTTVLAALLPLAAFAQSPTAIPSAPATQPLPPVPPAPPAPPAPPHRHMHEHDEDGPKEPVTFLGVETSEVPRVLSEQMGLPRGFGVVVDYVVPNGPAAAAGVQPSDIIRMLNDQQIVDPGQLGKLIRSFAEGTSIDLTLMRKGKETKVSVKLGKKDMPMGHGPFGFEQEWNFDDLDKMKFDFKAPDMTAVREAVARAKDQAMRARDEVQRAARGLRIVTTDDGLTKSTRIDLGKATITFSDDQGELKMENVNGRKMLTAKDAQGKVLYNGPIETAEDRANLPENVRQRFEKLERQELPEAPEPPEAPEAPRAPEPNESVRLQSAQRASAKLSPNNRTGWRRSTIVL